MLKLCKFNSEEGKLFRSKIKYKNFMTPEILGYTSINNIVIEISTGNKFLDLEMYGITVCGSIGILDYLSKCVHSEKEVEEYLEELNHIII